MGEEGEEAEEEERGMGEYQGWKTDCEKEAVGDAGREGKGR